MLSSPENVHNDVDIYGYSYANQSIHLGCCTFIGGSLESHLWLLLAFAPKFWEVVGTYELLFHLKKNAASVVLTMLGGGNTQTLLDDKNS